jgi:hypothetical protein
MCVALVLVLCVGCAQQSQTTQSTPTVTPQEQCVRAVFTVLAGMVDHPYDNRPFEDFATRYPAGSVTYSAYLSTFTPFYDLSATQGVRGAEDRLRPAVTQACAAAR